MFLERKNTNVGGEWGISFGGDVLRITYGHVFIWYFLSCLLLFTDEKWHIRGKEPLQRLSRFFHGEWAWQDLGTWMNSAGLHNDTTYGGNCRHLLS